MGGKSATRKGALGAPWSIVYFRRHAEDDPKRATPAREFLEACPAGVRADLAAIVKAVAEAPPPRFAGGGQWHVMDGQMRGFYEARTSGPNALLYRLFCILERSADGLPGPSILLIDGRSKPRGTALTDADYASVRRLGVEYRGRVPRSVA